MTSARVFFLLMMLTLMGAGWGMTQPLTKIAVSTGYGHFGLVFWQMVIGAVLLVVICSLRGTRTRITLARLRMWFMIAMIGTLVPNSVSYQAAVHLPAGVMSLLISTVPMFAFAIALSLGNDRFQVRRLVGLGFGLFGVLLIIAPSVDLGQEIPVFWAALYLFTAFCYGLEGNYVAKWGTQGLDPFQVMLGACVVGAVILLPVIWLSDQVIVPQWPLPPPQAAHVGSSVIHVMVYTSYVWMVGRAGPVFTAQVSYLVTGFGLYWAYLILGEAYAATLWLALGAVFVGMYLVQPRLTLAKPAAMGDTSP